MKEIKFRAWDKKSRKWIYFDSRDDKDYYLEWDGEDWKVLYYTAQMDIKYIYDFKLVQFTGLKDKNGKEIYEGDILYFKNDHIKKFSKVFWDKRMARYCLHIKIMFYSPKKEPVRVVVSNMIKGLKNSGVMGNIYENPELIK